MRITVVGTGYVGLVTGACLADKGNHVLGVDIDKAKIERLNEGDCPIFEPGLTELIGSNMASGRLRFTTDMAEAVSHSKVIFLAIGTPPDPHGAADLSAMEAAADTIAQLLDADTIIVIKSTVPVGTGAKIEQRIRRQVSHRVHLVSNPEFLKEGSAVEDFQRPDRVIVGANDEDAARVIRELYVPFVRNQRPILTMRREAAEMSKYAANCYLAMRISFINEIADLCEGCGVNVDEVRIGMGSDERIGFHFLYPGVGYGGSCFPKDVQALAHVGRSVGRNADILTAVHRVNIQQKEILFRKISERFDGELAGKTFALWGVTFKPRTDDIREAPALTIIEKLLDAQAQVAVHDPQGLPHLKRLFGDRIRYCPEAYEPLADADALVIVTEWNEFASPDFDMIRDRLKRPLIFDGRNIYDLESMERRGFEYHSIGRPIVHPANAS